MLTVIKEQTFFILYDIMSGIVSYSFRLNITVMKLLGLYPSENYTNLHRKYAVILFICATVPIFILGLFHFAYTKELSDISNNDFVLVAMLIYTFKLLPFVINNTQIEKIILYFEVVCYAVTEAEHKNIIDECVSTCRRNSLVFFFGCIVSVISAFLQIFAGGDIYQYIWVPSIIGRTPALYYCLYFSSILGTVYAALACGTIDPLIGGLLHHASAQLRVLKHSLCFVDADNGSLISKPSDTYGKIKMCIRRYQGIVNFVKEYQSFFSVVVFVQLTGSVVVIGLLCFLLTKMDFDINFLIGITDLVLIFFQIFFYCYYGTLLIEENNTLTNAIYMSKWYEYDQQSKKALLILMECSKQPMTVTAGKILDISLETFTTVLKRSYSLVAVLKNY